MAGFNFESLKNGFSKFGESFRSKDTDEYNREDEEPLYDEEDTYASEYDEEYADDAYQDDGEVYDEYEDDDASSYDEEGIYEEGDYVEEGEFPYEEEEAVYDDEAGYEDESEYDEAAYEDEAEYDEEAYEEGYYDDAPDPGAYSEDDYDAYDEYDSEGYPEDDENPDYDDYNVDPDKLGFNPAVFANLDNEEAYAGEADEEDYPEDEYEDGVYPEDVEGGEDVYDDDDDRGYTGVGAIFSGILAFITENDWIMYLALVVLPPLGIWLLWRKNRFDISLRTAISVVSFVWFIILLILLFRGGGKDDPTINPNPDFTNFTPTPSVTATMLPTQTNAADLPGVVPSATPRVTATETDSPYLPGTETQITYVWAANSDIYYHNLENCGGMTNASKMTLDSATSRGKVACPTCIGGTGTPGTTGSTPTGTTYYATSGGKWYHTVANCQGMSGASVVTEANAIAAGKTACPECIGYYGTNGGKWYHTVSNCQGMQNAVTKNEAEWKALGKTACPECMTGKAKVTPTSTMVYATSGGKYFHTKSNCSGMKNASNVTVAQAVAAKKNPCPDCVKASNVYVFATAGGKHFHTKSNCSGMKNAQYVTAAFAMQYGKTACPDCASVFSSSSSSNLSNTSSSVGTPASSNSASYVYATKGGTYMHTRSDCSGMKDASRVTYQQAVSAGKKLCPTCMKASNLTVYATSGGKYYHTDADCSGMKNAVALKASTAISYGKSACPTCAKGLSSSSSSGSSSSGSSSSGSSSSASASSTVYIKLGSGATNYYHVGAKCSAQGVSGASNVTLEYAINHGYRACPSCKPPSKMY